jgi:hypothetical protein
MEVRVMTGVKLPETILIKVVRPLGVVGAMTLGGLLGERGLEVIVEVLVKVVVDPPDIVLVRVKTTVEMVGELASPLGTGNTLLPIVVRVTLISVVICPPETILVIVIVISDVPNADEIGSVLVGNVGNDDVDTEGLDEDRDVGEGEIVYGVVNISDGLPYDGVMDTEEMSGVISSVLVISVLN